MLLQHGDGIFQKTTCVVFVKSISMELAQLANIPAMTAASVRYPHFSRRFIIRLTFFSVSGKCGHNFHMVSIR